MNRYVSDEFGNMFECEQGAWVKHDDYENLSNEYIKLRREVARLGIESLERERVLARLESEILYMKKIYGGE